MKELLTTSLRHLSGKRYLIVLLIVLGVVSIGAVLYVLVTTEPSELRIVTHYSAYGVAHFYRDQWYYLLTFAVYPLLVALIHATLAIKVLIVKNESLARSVAWLGIYLVIIGWLTYARIEVF